MEGVAVKHYDLVVIGAGPGGYVAAIKAAQIGMRVAVVEKKSIGGTCLNVGCIPSKAYLKHAEWLLSMKEAQAFGIEHTLGAIHFEQLVARKDGVVASLQGGIHHLFKKNEIAYFEGEAAVTRDKMIQVGTTHLTADKILLATGSTPFVPPISGIEQAPYHTTDTFFDMTTLPDKLVIIGGGVIAVELAFAMAPLGVAVTLLEVAPDILLTEEQAVRTLLKKKLQALDCNVHTNVQINQVSAKDVQTSVGTFTFDELLVATGRKANLALAEQLNLKSERFIEVNANYETSMPGVYAIGDAIGGYMLAHAASAEGLHAVAHMAGENPAPLQQTLIPRCIYTTPEVASFGLSEEEAKNNGYDVRVSSMPFSMIGKAIATNETEGFVKIISETTYNEILGAVIVGAHATEMIHTIIAVKKAEGCVDELADLAFGHPSLSELTGEVANSLISQAIHG